MLPIMLSLLASAVALPAAEPPRQDPAVRVWLNKGNYVERAEKVKAYVRTGVDGYLLVLHAEPSGRVRVLFPLDPGDDAFVRAGQDYEIRSRSDREAFAVYDGTGPGVVLAAVARDAFHFDKLAFNGHWDYRSQLMGVGNDPEADLLAIVQEVTAGGWYEYDVAQYQMADSYIAYDGDATYHMSMYGSSYAGHYWDDGVGFSIGIGVGPIGFGVGWYDPWYWSSWCYWGCYGGYYPYAYGYYPYYAYPYGYYGYPYYGYPGGYYGGYYGPNYPTHYYAGGAYGTGYYAGRGGAWGSYAFKSEADRYGLQPQSVTARRRTVGEGSAYAASPARGAAYSTGRRTAGAGTPASSPGSLEARRPAPNGNSSTVLPTIHGRSRAAATTSSAPRATPGQGAGADGRRSVSPAGVGPRGTAVDGSRRSTDLLRGTSPGVSGDRRATQPGARSMTGLRTVEPQRIDDGSPPSSVRPSGQRPMQGSVGSGRTTNPSNGSLQRRTPSRSASPPSSAGPSRSGSPPRSSSAGPSRSVSPPRSMPSTRSASPRSAPSMGGARAPARSAPSGGRRH